MNVIKLGGKVYIRETHKEKGFGKIKYRLWVDGNYELHVQFEENENTGTYSDRAFRVSEFVDNYLGKAALDTTIGYDVHTGEIVKRADNNDAGFLRAVLKHLLQETKEDEGSLQ